MLRTAVLAAKTTLMILRRKRHLCGARMVLRNAGGRLFRGAALEIPAFPATGKIVASA